MPNPSQPASFDKRLEQRISLCNQRENCLSLLTLLSFETEASVKNVGADSDDTDNGPNNATDAYVVNLIPAIANGIPKKVTCYDWSR